MMTKEMFQAMRLRSPNPVNEPPGGWHTFAQSGDDESYCVGGAFVSEVMNQTHAFPTTTLIAVCLSRMNPDLGEWDTMTRARQIVAANDEEDFDLAWKWIAGAVVVGGVE